MLPKTHESIITELDPQQFFQDALLEAIARQQLRACHETTIYLSNMLTVFIHAEQLFEQTSDGPQLKPLAGMYAEAAEARSINERDSALRQLGDVALFIAGLFPQSLGRSLVDVDYYINMGGGAYGFLAESSRVSRTAGTFKKIFHELSARFAQFVDLLAEVGDATCLSNNGDVLRLYEIWLASGSRNAAGKLQALGIQPVPINRHAH